MTRSLNQLVYELIELYRANYKVTDSLDERLIASWIQNTRALIIKQISVLRNIDPHLIQTLKNVPLVLDTAISVPGFNNKSKVLRTQNQLPSFVDDKNNVPLIIRVYGGDLISYSFNIISAKQAVYSGSGKFNNNAIYTFLYDKYLYLFSKSGIHNGIEYINIDGVFNNPIEAYEFINGVDSYNWDFEYPISESIVAQLNDLVVKTKFNFILFPPQDPINNANDDLTRPQTSPQTT